MECSGWSRVNHSRPHERELNRSIIAAAKASKPVDVIKNQCSAASLPSWASEKLYFTSHCVAQEIVLQIFKPERIANRKNNLNLDTKKVVKTIPIQIPRTKF